MEKKKYGRVTVPTDLDMVSETKDIVKYWGADALRDCDGTNFPEELVDMDAKLYATYYTTRKDNEWAKANLDEVQQCYIMTKFYSSQKDFVEVPLMNEISPDLLKVNTRDNIKRWWEVIDRTTNKIISTDRWNYDEDTQTVIIKGTTPYNEYTVSFLAYLIWDPVHMYNAVINNWVDVEHQMTFDVRQPKTHVYSMQRLRDFIKQNPHIDVIRFTTFFHQFTLVFDELRREKYVDWYGYSASVSPYILEQFEEEVGYPFRPEYIIDQGYYNGQYRIPTKEYNDFMAFQRREVAKLAKKMVDICHENGKEAMMFLGDHWIGVEPFMDEFKSIGLDAVVGSVGNGSTLRLISDIKGVKYTEGRFLPYFFPDTFNKEGNPTKEAKENWVTARRAILRSTIQRIGYGGYLKLALDFPDFVEYIKDVTDEFRVLYDNIHETKAFCFKKVAVLNAWGKARAWGGHMVHHALYDKLNKGYAGVIESLSGAPFDVVFISFDDILKDKSILEDIDVIINVGDAYTAHSGGEYWTDPDVINPIREFIAKGKGFIGIGEPSGCQHQGRFFQLGAALGVEYESGFTLGYSFYNLDEKKHFILEDAQKETDFGIGKNNIYAFRDASVLKVEDGSVQLAANDYYDGRAVYISGLPYNFENARLLHRAIMWSCGAEKDLYKWFSSNPYVDVHAYPENKKYCVVNNTYEPQKTTVYTVDGESYSLNLDSNEIKWYEI